MNCTHARISAARHLAVVLIAIVACAVTGNAFAACRTYQAPASSIYAGEAITIGPSRISVSGPLEAPDFYSFFVNGLDRRDCEGSFACYGVGDSPDVRVRVLWSDDNYAAIWFSPEGTRLWYSECTAE